MNQIPIRFEDHKGIVHMQAKFGLRWAHGVGLAMDYDDMFQEASVAFVQAAAGFDPDKGIKFSAYFTMAAFSQFRKTIGVMSGVKNLNRHQRQEITDRKEENKTLTAAGLQSRPDYNYGLKPMRFSELTLMGEEGGESFEARIASDEPTPEEILEEAQERQVALRRLSPLSQLVVEWLQDPPEALLKELMGQASHDVLGTNEVPCGGDVTVQSIGRFLKLISDDLSDADIVKVDSELTSIRRKYESALRKERKAMA